MVLIIGGMCQGKHDFCSREFPEARIVEHYEDRIRSELKDGKDPVSEAGKWLETEIKAGSGEMIMTSANPGNQVCVSPESAGDENHSVNDKCRELVIIMNEVGSGVVPMEREERIWREAVGRVSCLFAAKADSVFRLIAGIPQKLK